MKKIVALILSLCFVLFPVSVYGATAKVTPGKKLWTVTSNKAVITGRISYAGGQLVVLYNAKGNPVSYQKMSNTGRASNFSLKTSTLKQGTSSIFYIKSLKSKHIGASISKAVVVTYADPNRGTKGAQAAIKWAVKIANDNSWNYGNGLQAGCYLCGTRKQKCYTCMPFITAAYAHGAKDSDVLALCKKKHSLSLHMDSDWKMLIKKKKFKYVGKCSDLKFSDLRPGDILIEYSSDDAHGHMCMYIGGNDIVEAAKEGFCADALRVTKNSAKKRFNQYKNGLSQCGQGKNNFVMRYCGK